MNALILGAGIFGTTGALELAKRGWQVELIDPGPLPHALAASTDLSKVVRLEYGTDEEYVELGERSLAGWRRWNRELGAELFHETGVAFLRRSPVERGSFEGDSLELLRRRGHPIERLTREDIRKRFPAWNFKRYFDGIFNRSGGWVESGRVVARLLELARASGVTVTTGASLESLSEDGGSIRLSDGSERTADCTIAALGSWTPHALPHTAGFFRSSGMPVFHLRPAEPAQFLAESFPVFGADISETGYYGFPLHPEAGVVKIANHGPGRLLHPSSDAREVTDDEISRLREFLAETFPALASAPLAATRVCVYCDTWDGHFWIARDPGRPRLVLATGGSGHAFKFAPALGPLIADAVEGRERPRFRHRPDVRPPRSEEAARHQS
jgi:glycine/D-amino acid oxidase-like deaminating enzyme